MELLKVLGELLKGSIELLTTVAMAFGVFRGNKWRVCGISKLIFAGQVVDASQESARPYHAR